MTEDSFVLHSDSPLQDFGRESLGILPSDFGRESLGFPIANISLNREAFSLGNIRLSDYGHESSDCGRESLGILSQSVLDNNYGDVLNTAFAFSSPRKGMSFLDNIEKTPKIKLTTIEESDSKVFAESVDKKFLFPNPRRPLLSSISSQTSGVPSFNSFSLEGPSKIYSLSRSEYIFPSCNHLNISLGNSDLDKAKFITTAEIEDHRPRIKSMPNTEANVENFDENEFKKFWSTGKANPMESCSKMNMPGEKLNFDDNKEDLFYDSIFIEGSNIAQKIADGSIFSDSNVLDSTSQPSWPSDLDDSGANEKKTVDTETVFKTIDKLLPERLYAKIESQKTDKSPNDPKDVKEILQNLSEILNNTHRSDQEKSQGQNLLSSLAEMLHGSSFGSKAQVLDDSGHSSFVEQNESPNQEQYEVLNFSKKSLDGNSDKINSFDNIRDLSSKLEANKPMERKLSQSFCTTTPLIEASKLGNKLRRNSSVSGMGSVKNESGNSNLSSRSNNSQGSGNNLMPNKFRSKPSSSIASKGPLKAIIPVKDMRRKNQIIAVTPEKSQQPSEQSLKSKRTSTPMNEPKLKPMAASTPSSQYTENKLSRGSKGRSMPGNSSNEISLERQRKQQDSPRNKRSHSSPPTKKVPAEKSKKNIDLPRYQRSPASSSASMAKSKTNTSKLEGAPKLDYKSVRRNSVDEGNYVDHLKLKRSNSLGKETGIMSSLSRVRENLMKSPYFQGERKALLEKNQVRRMGSDPTIATIKMLSKPKISNKENAK